MKHPAFSYLLAAIALAFCGCGKSNKSSSGASPTPAPPLVVAKSPPPAPIAAVPVDHAFDADGFVAHDLAHGDGAFRLLVNRQWNGASVRAGHFGPGWSDGNALRLTMVDRDHLLLWRGEVGWRQAHRTGEKMFAGDGGEKIQQTARGWTAQMAGGIKLAFDDHGRLVSAQAANGPACTYTYEKNGRLASVGTSAENTLKYRYDSSGKHVTRIDGPEGLRLEYEYDKQGRLAATTNSRRLRIQYRYGNDGALAAAEDQFGNRFDFTQPIKATATRAEPVVSLAGPTARSEGPSGATEQRDPFGRVINRADPNGRSARFEYNNLDLPTLIAVNGQPVERRQYDEHGMLVRRERGRYWEEFAYDSGGRLGAKRSATSAEQHYEFDADDRIERVKQVNGPEIYYQYAPDGKLTDESSSTGEKRHWNYNAAGRLLDYVDQNGLKTTFGYDQQGRLSYSEDPVHGRKLVSYREDEVTTDAPDAGVSVVKTTPWGKPLSESRAGNRQTVFRYDNTGKLTGVISPAGMLWNYEMDGANRLHAITSPSGLTSVIERDQAGRVQKVARGEIARREFRYDNAGRVQQKFSGAGSIATCKYDDRGRLSEAVLPEGKVTYAYEEKGFRLKGPGYEIEESYHDDGSLARRSYQPAGLELKLPRDAQGRSAGIELNQLKVSYGYNARGQVEQINLPKGAIKISRDDAGRPATLAFGNAATLEIKYDRADRITGLEAKQQNGRTLFNERYSYDSAGNLVARAAEKFEYDLDDRLTTISGPKAPQVLFYDIDGNLSGRQLDHQTRRFSLDELGRPTEDGATSFSWSATGNLERTESAKATIENVFDAADRLVRRSDGTNSWSFGYLPDGDRLWEESAGKKRWFAYLPDRLAGFKDEAGVDWLLVSLPGSDWPVALAGSNGKTLFILADHLGSARRFLDESGALVASIDYAPFGQINASSGKAPLNLFAGMVLDENGLCYARQRYYDPRVARFISLDPELGTPGYPATHNPYAYAGNNPLRHRDPRGTDFASEVAAPDSNIYHCLNELQQAAVKEAWDGALRASRVLNSPMVSTPEEIAAASRHLQECNAALEQMNQIARAQYKYQLLAYGPTAELSEIAKANAARNTAEAKAALEALGEMPRVGRVNLGLNAENLGSTLQNGPLQSLPISPSRALVPGGASSLGDAGTAARGAGAGAEWSSASGAWDEGIFTGQSPIDKFGRIKGEIPMTYDPKYGGWKPALPPSGSASSFAVEESGRWLGPKILDASGKVLNAAGPILQILNAIEVAKLGGTAAKNYIDNLNQPFLKDRAADLAARYAGDELAQRLAELAASDPNAIILGDGRKFDPNNPDDLAEILQGLSQNLYFGRKPFDGILKYIPKLDPNVLPKTYLGAAPGDTAIDVSLENARKLLQEAYAKEKTAREAAAELAKQEAEAQAKLQSAMTTAGARAVTESDVAGILEKLADLKAKTAATKAETTALQSADTEMRAAIAKCDAVATKVCDYAGRASGATEDEIAAWRTEATNDLGSASNQLNSAQAKIDNADVSIDGLKTAIGLVDGLSAKVAIYKGGSLLAEKADISPDAALAAARAADANATKARTELTSSLGELRGTAGEIIKLVAPYLAGNPEASILNAAASSLGKGIAEPGFFNFELLLSAALPVIDAAIANQKKVEAAIGQADLDPALTEAREALATAEALRRNATALATGIERYRPLQTASQCFGLIKSAPKDAEETPSPTPEETSPSPGASPDDELVTVPPVKGAESIEYARIILNQAGFKSAFKALKPSKKEEELTIAPKTAPAAGEKAPRGSTVVVFIYQKFDGSTAEASPTPTPPTLGPGTLGGAWKGQIAVWQGKVTRLDGTNAGDWSFYIRKRNDGRFEYFLNSIPLDQVQTQGGKILAKTAEDAWVGGQPEILREIFLVTVEPSPSGKVVITMTERIVMRAGGESDRLLVRTELAPVPDPVGTGLEFYADDTVEKILAQARQQNKEHEEINARSH